MCQSLFFNKVARLRTRSLEENNNLKSICKCNFNKLFLAHLNMNSVRNKFNNLTQQIIGNFDILMISETKLDSSWRS